MHLALPKRYVVGGLLMAIFWLCALQGSMHAAPVVDNIGPGLMPSYIEDYLLDCGDTNGAVAQTGWVSLRGRPTETVIDVPNATTTTVDLQYNVAGIVCRNSIKGGIVSTTNGIISTEPSTLGISGTGSAYAYGSSDGSLSLGVPIPFTYTSATAFTTTTDINIGISEKRIHTYSVSTRYRCVTNPGDTNFRTPTSSVDFGACRSIAVPIFTIRVNVPPPVPARPNLSCTVSGASIIAGQTATATLVISHNGPASAPTSSYSGTLQITSQPSENLSGSVGNGLAVTQNGTTRTYTVPGSYTVTVDLTSSSSAGGRAFSCTNTITVTAPAPTITCTVTSGGVDVGSNGFVTVSVRHTGPTYAPNLAYDATVTITSQPTEHLTGSLVNGTVAVRDSTARLYPNAGVYNVTVSVSATGGGFTVSSPPPCTTTITIYARPYLRTYNNDVQAGYGFTNAGTCENGTGDITAYTRSGANSYSGSGTQLGAFARGQISGFRSASTLATAATLPEVIAFANTTLVNTAAGRFGGSFSAGNCMFDYWSQSSRAAVITNQVVDISTLETGSYYVEQTSATVPVVITGQIANSRRVSVYVNGAAFVRGASVGYSSANWSTRGEIPSLYVIARGDILIGSDVRNLDGNYIAQNRNLTDGRITTCADTTTLRTFSSNASLLANCATRLVVNGSFSARRINFLRTIGTVNVSVPGEAASVSNASEVFIYSLENFMGEQALDGLQQQEYDSITALPPIL